MSQLPSSTVASQGPPSTMLHHCRTGDPVIRASGDSLYQDFSAQFSLFLSKTPRGPGRAMRRKGSNTTSSRDKPLRPTCNTTSRLRDSGPRVSVSSPFSLAPGMAVAGQSFPLSVWGRFTVFPPLIASQVPGARGIPGQPLRDQPGGHSGGYGQKQSLFGGRGPGSEFMSCLGLSS